MLRYKDVAITENTEGEHRFLFKLPSPDGLTATLFRVESLDAAHWVIDQRVTKLANATVVADAALQANEAVPQLRHSTPLSVPLAPREDPPPTSDSLEEAGTEPLAPALPPAPKTPFGRRGTRRR